MTTMATPTSGQIYAAYARYGIHLDRPNSRGECTVRCPFHGDRKASMSVNSINGLWNCHASEGCGGGNVFRFVMRLEGCDFSTAKAIVRGKGVNLRA